MHCDHVFDILTRGPFPTGQPHDSAVERHLACCHECHTMAEALRPAVDLIHESMADDAGRVMLADELPVYRGGAATATGVLPEAVQRLIDRPGGQPDRSRGAPRGAGRRRVLLGWVAAAIVIATVVWTGGWRGGPESARAPGEPGRPAESSPPQLGGGTALAQLQLSEACYREAEQPAEGAAAAAATLHCCTRCHNAANPQSPRIDSFARLENSCRGCHAP